MANTGTITSYDSGRGAGTITPDGGGKTLPFGKADLQRESQSPAINDHYSFETHEVNGSGFRATDLRRQNGEEVIVRQARAQRG